MSWRINIEVPEHHVARADAALRAAGLIVQQYVKAGEFRYEIVADPFDDARAFVPKFLRYRPDAGAS